MLSLVLNNVFNKDFRSVSYLLYSAGVLSQKEIFVWVTGNKSLCLRD